MPQTSLFPNAALLAQTNYTGAYTDIDDDPDSPDANWLTVTSLGTDASVRIPIDTPPANPTTTSNAQQIRIWVREQAGNKTPDFSISVYENGTSRALLASAVSVTGTGTLYTYNWTYTGFTNADGSGVEVFIDAPAPHPGGGGVDIGAVEWLADHEVPITPVSISDTLLPKVDEGTTNIADTLHVLRSDAINPRVDEPTLTAMNKVIGIVETLLPRIDEPTDSAMRRWIAISETLRPRIDEQFASAGTMNRSDILLLSIIDAVIGNKAIFGVSDSLTPRIDTVVSIPAFLGSVSPDPFDDQQTNITITGYGFGVTQGTGKVEVGDNSNYATANLEEQTVTSWSADTITFTGVVSTLGPSDQRWVFVTNDLGSVSDGTLVGTHRAHAFALADSANILASGENTTAQLTPPSGKTTGDFGGGRIQDDENPGDSVDIGKNQYREDEWAIIALDAAILDQQYEFRVVVSGVSSTTPYTELVVPVWTVQTPAIPKPVSDTLLVSVNDLVSLFKQMAVQDDLRVSMIEAMNIFSAFTRTDDLFVRLDSVASIISSLSRTDSLSIRLDYFVTLFSVLSRADSLDVNLVDDINTLIAYLSRADVLYPQIADASSIVEVFAKYAVSDDILPKIDEVFTILTSLSISDEVLPRMDDTASIIAVFARIGLSDTLLPTFNEAVAILSAFTRVDDLNLTIDDILDILSFIVGRYRWRADDGTEATATWLAAENTDVEREININTRLRIQVDTDGDTGVTQFVLQYRKVGDPDWEWRDVI